MAEHEQAGVVLYARSDVMRVASRERKVTLFFPLETELEVGDWVTLTDGMRNLSMEVCSVKVTRFSHIRPHDLHQSIPEHRHPREVLAMLRRTADDRLRPADLLKVVELEAITYDLTELNRMVRRHRRRYREGR